MLCLDRITDSGGGTEKMNLHVGAGHVFGLPVPEEIAHVQADGDELEAIRSVLPSFCPPITTARVVRWDGDLARFVYEYGVLPSI